MTSYIYKEPLIANAENILYQSQCDNPKTYRIGSIDPKYNMSQRKFIENINQAADIWDNEIGKELFTYDPKGKIEINLVYDQRSFLSGQINQLNSQVKQQQNELDPKIEDYKRRAGEFRAKISQLNSNIEYWNSRGGAPPEEYEKLRNRQASLQQEADALRTEADSLNLSTEQYNQQVGELRQTVDNFNQELNFKPEEGEYIYDNGQETINIYFDNSETELIHTLAHELGHALAIDHNNNPESIMYPQTSEAIALSIEDKTGIRNACEKKSVIATGAERFTLLINRVRLQLAK